MTSTPKRLELALAAWDNAARLQRDSGILIQAGRHVSAALLSVCALEEDEKGSRWFDQALTEPRARSSSLHNKKGDRAIANLMNLFGDTWRNIVGTSSDGFTGAFLKDL